MSASEQPRDPVLARRARAAAVARAGKRLGGLLYLVAMAAFVAGYAAGFTSGWATTAAAALIAGSLVLAPAIVLSYMVKAADREDAEAGRPTL